MPVILSPEDYPSFSTYDLLRAAARLQVGIDHRLLRVIIERGEAVFPDFLRFFKEKREEDRIELDEDLLSIARQLRTPASLPFLLEYASARGFNFPDELTLAFVELGPAAVEPLLELHRQSNGAADVAFTLAALGVRDPRILEVLLRGFEADPHEGAMQLGIYGDPAAKPVLEAALEKAEDDATRRAIAGALEDLASEKPSEPLEPYDIWDDYPEEEEPYFGLLDDRELVEFLSSPVAAYRAEAVRTLATGELNREQAARIFELAKTDPDVEVRAECWEALADRIDDAEILAEMESRLYGGSAPAVERAGIAAALATSQGSPEQLYATIRELQAIPEARARAIRAMWHSYDRRFAEYIPPFLDDPDPKVREQAVLAVGWLGIVSQLGRLEQFFNDARLRHAALYAYCLAAPGPISPARARSLFRRIETLAGGLSEGESGVIERGLDDRLRLDGYEPIFEGADDEWDDEEDIEDEEYEMEPQPPPGVKVGRNDPCPCGSGLKYKKCCGK